jgi:hypothetical protein
MENQQKWRTTITIWIAAICVTAVICSWQLKDYRYQAITHDQYMAFDKATGKYYSMRGAQLPIAAD